MRRFAARYGAPNIDTLLADPGMVTVFPAAEADAGVAPLTIGWGPAAISWMHRVLGCSRRRGARGRGDQHQ